MLSRRSSTFIDMGEIWTQNNLDSMYFARVDMAFRLNRTKLSAKCNFDHSVHKHKQETFSSQISLALFIKAKQCQLLHDRRCSWRFMNSLNSIESSIVHFGNQGTIIIFISLRSSSLVATKLKTNSMNKNASNFHSMEWNFSLVCHWIRHC